MEIPTAKDLCGHDRFKTSRALLEQNAIVQETGGMEALANRLLGATFFFSAIMNYLLATWIVTSPAGSTAFNEELKKEGSDAWNEGWQRTYMRGQDQAGNTFAGHQTKIQMKDFKRK